MPNKPSVTFQTQMKRKIRMVRLGVSPAEALLPFELPLGFAP